MSVINKMLRDLDRRHVQPEGGATAVEAIRSTKAVSAWTLGRNGSVFMGTLLAVSIAGAGWMQWRGGPAQQVVEAPPVPLPAHQPQPAALAAPEAVAQLAPAASQAPVTVAAAPESIMAASAPASAPAPAPVPVPPSRPKPVAMAANVPTAVEPVPAPAKVPESVAVAVAAPARLAPEALGAADKTEKAEKNEKAEAPAPATALKATAMSSSAGGGAAAGKTYSPKQLAANLLSQAVVLDQQGRLEEAKAPLQRALAANALDAPARKLLVRLQLDTGRLEDARTLLAEGQRLHPEDPDFTLVLARLKAEAGDSAGAIQLLEAGRSQARGEPQYHALLAALLLQAQRYDEAIDQYLVALRSDPANASWLLGVGVALERQGKVADAAEAYRRAGGAPNLSGEMAAFLSEGLARLKLAERNPATLR
jgi:MSHA biogenesis protein MshN